VNQDRPVVASALLGFVAFLFAAPLGVGLAILVLGAGSAPAEAIVAISLTLTVFAVFTLSALHVSPVWSILGVAAGFAGFFAWLAYAFSDMD
jgi:hypothetical protein